MNIFLNNFEDRQSILSHFGNLVRGFRFLTDGTTTSHYLGDGKDGLDAQFDRSNILVASYETPSYEGYAFVLFEDPEDGKIYEVNGSHCSCRGLEGQWTPEEATLDSLLHRATKGTIIDKETAQAVREVVEMLLVEREEGKNFPVR